MKYTVLISQGSEFLIARIKEIPSVITQGMTVEEVMDNISDALTLFTEDTSAPIETDNLPVGEQNYGTLISTRELEFA